MRLVLAALAVLLLAAATPAQAEAKERRCGKIAFTPRTEDGVFRIRADGTSCRIARAVARASEPIGVTDKPRRYRARFFRCRGHYVDEGLPRVRWRCVRDLDGDGAVVRFIRS